MILHDSYTKQQDVSGEAWGTQGERREVKCVLIVDDEPDHRLVLRTMLEGCGYDCEEAQDGMEALDVLGKADVHVVLTDLQMPRMNGVQLVKHVASHATFKSIPVILVTSQTPDLIPSFDERKKIFTILSKPYEWPRVLTAVAKAIEGAARTPREISLAVS